MVDAMHIRYSYSRWVVAIIASIPKGEDRRRDDNLVMKGETSNKLR